MRAGSLSPSRSSSSGFDDCGSTKSTGSSFDLVSRPALAGSTTYNGHDDGSAPHDEKRSSKVSRAAEASYAMARDHGVPTFMKDWWSGSNSADESAPPVPAPDSADPSAAETSAAVPIASSTGVAEFGWRRATDGAEETNPWFTQAAGDARSYLFKTTQQRQDQDALPPQLAPQAQQVVPLVVPASHTAAPAAPVADQDDDTEWALERVLKRKTITIDVDVDDEITSRFAGDDGNELRQLNQAAAQGRVTGACTNKTRKTWAYLCKWRGYEEPTWETREALEDFGFQADVDWFDSWLLTAASCNAPPLPPSSVLSLPRTNGHTNGHNLPDQDPEKLDPVAYDAARNLLDFDDLFPDLPFHVHKSCGFGMRVAKYARIDPPARNAAFDSAWRAAWAAGYEVAPVIVYYGTLRQNVRSVLRYGLLPATSPGKRRGGLIFTSRSAALSATYADETAVGGSRFIFACVGLVGSLVGGRDKVIVFSNPANVIPVWLVEVAPRCIAGRESSAADHTPEPICTSGSELVSELRATMNRDSERRRTERAMQLCRAMREKERKDAAKGAEAVAAEKSHGGEIRGMSQVGDSKVPSHYVHHGVRQGDVKNQPAAVKQLVRHGEIKVAKNKRSTKRNKPSREARDS
jgi:hypothetical protein